MKRFLVVLLLATAAACDSGTEPVRVSSVGIFQGGVQAEEETIPVGGTLQLSARVRDAAGNPLIRPIEWRSSMPPIASVDTAGKVTALGPGSTLIIATAEGIADTVRLTVFVPQPRADVECAPGATPLQLRLGEVRTFRAEEAGNLCFSGGSGESSAEFTLIPFNARASGTLTLEVAAGGVTTVAGPPSPSVSPTFSLTGRAGPQLDHSFHDRIRQWERENFSRVRNSRSRVGGGPNFSISASTATTPKVGDVLSLNVSTAARCTNPVWRGSRVEAVSQRAIIASDTTNPEGGFTDVEYQQFAAVFDRDVWPILTQTMGEPSDIDSNERVIILFTRAVNELTERGSGSYVGGFYWGRDLMSRTGTDACEGSNQAEMFYQLAVDTGGVYGDKRSKSFVAERTMGVIAHEFQHLVNYSRRVFVNNATTDEVVWLNEGLSHIAEELVFYNVSGLNPLRNIDRSTALTEPVRSPFIEYGSSNVARLISWTREPSLRSPIQGDHIATRGAIWSFLRYAGDRKVAPGGQRQLWYDLVNSTSRGMTNLENVFGIDPIEWLHEWSISMYLDDSGTAAEAQHNQPSWNFRSLMTAYTSTNGQFPLATVQLQNGSVNQRNLTLQPGSSAYLRMGVATGTTAAVRTTASQVAPPAHLRLTVVRTR